jgi:GTP-binding protein
MKPVEQKGPAVPEFAVIGRSNVGKSSLINTLTSRKVARTSSTPGATRMINLYRIEYEFDASRQIFIMSDFPGFGYSKVSRSTYSAWEGMIDGYLTANKHIRRLIWVYDVRREIDELDGLVLEWIAEKGLPFTMVLTKTDKEGRSFSAGKRKALITKLPPATPVFLFSAKDKTGRQDLVSHLCEEAPPGAGK